MTGRFPNSPTETKLIAWLAIITALSTYALIFFGGIVRVTDSGLGCPDWPLCYGQVIPPLDPPAWIETIHRWVAGVVSMQYALVGGLVLARRRQERGMVLAVLIALPFLLMQIILGALNVIWEIPPLIALSHTAVALLFLAAVVILAVLSTPALRAYRSRLRTALVANAEGLRRWLMAASAGFLVLMLTGGYVTRSGASLACTAFPHCGVQPATEAGWQLVTIHMLHRYTALAVTLLFGLMLLRMWRLGSLAASLRKWTLGIGLLFLVQIALGAINVLFYLPMWSRALHLAVAAAIWSGLMILLALLWPGRRVGNQQKREVSAEGQKPATTIGAYFALTKPYITILLLVTTVAAMVMAQQGLPSFELILWTMLGGFLAASSANTLNSYLDRDVDARMTRTSRRPVPSGRVPARHALLFGLTLGVAALLIFIWRVNGLSAALTALAILYYVLVYTMYLKRRTPHNIVIGGAAGALPPIIGWVAVTGRLDVLPLYLFAIVFYWTPPHTWALTLLVDKDYRRAHIPMLPVARGQEETRRQILLYTLLMVAITVFPVGLRLLGMVYLASSLILGLAFLIMAIRLLQRRQKRYARALYKFSTLYLALLFGAMVADRVLLFA